MLGIIQDMRLHGDSIYTAELRRPGSPRMICIVRHQVLCHPSEHETSWMGKHLLEKAHIAKLNELTESEVTELTSSTVDGTALAVLKRQRCRGITIVWSQSRIVFDTLVDPYWPKWQTKRSKLAAKDIETSEFHQDTCNRYLVLGFFFISNSMEHYIESRATTVIWGITRWPSAAVRYDS